MNAEVKSQLADLLSRGYYSKESIGICSLSEISDSEEMWGKYADNDRGYCIEYSFENYINILYLFRHDIHIYLFLSLILFHCFLCLLRVRFFCYLSFC